MIAVEVHVRRLRPVPGDLIVVYVADEMSDADLRLLSAVTVAALPAGVHSLVLAGVSSVALMGDDELAALGLRRVA